MTRTSNTFSELDLPFMGDPWFDWGAANFAEFAECAGCTVSTTPLSWKIQFLTDMDVLAEVETQALGASCRAMKRVIISRDEMKPVLADAQWWRGTARLSDTNEPTSAETSTLNDLRKDNAQAYQLLLTNCACIYIGTAQKVKNLERLKKSVNREEEERITRDLKALKSQFDNKALSVPAAAAAVLAFEIDRIGEGHHGIPDSAVFWSELQSNISGEFSRYVQQQIADEWAKRKEKSRGFDAFVRDWKFPAKAGNKFYYDYGEIKSKARRTDCGGREIMQDFVPHVTTKCNGANCVSGFADSARSVLGPVDRVRAVCANLHIGFFSASKMKVYFWPVADSAEHLSAIARSWRGLLKEAGKDRSNLAKLAEWNLAKPHEVEWAIAFELYCWLRDQGTHSAVKQWKNQTSLCFLREDKVNREYCVYHRFSDFVRLLDCILGSETGIDTGDLRKFVMGLRSKSSANDKNSWLWRERICRRFLEFEDIGPPFMELSRQEVWKNGKRTGKPRHFHAAEKILPAYYKALNLFQHERSCENGQYTH